MDSGRTLATPIGKGPSSSPPPSGAHRQSLQRYRPVVALGYGRLTEAFLATRQITPFVQELVVLKQVHKHLADSPEFVETFLKGAALLRALEHPHIIKILEAGVIGDRCCVAEEYVEGQPLRLLLRQAWGANGLPHDLAAYIAICMLEGLHYAHEVRGKNGQNLSIVHRDLAPHNVLIANDGRVKITNFGIGEFHVEGGAASAASPRDDISYVAPEQRSHAPVDRRADVWSVGVVLWEALTGKRLFDTDNGSAPVSIDPGGKRAIPAPSSVQPDVPAALDAVVARALSWNVAERYQSALDMQRDLEPWLATAGRDKDPAALGALMHRLFANEVFEQRRLVAVLSGGDDPSNGPPTSRSPYRSASTTLPPPPPPPPTGRSPGRSARGSLPKLPPPPLNPATRTRSDSSRTHAFDHRWLVAVAVLCAGLSAALTYVFIWTARARPVAARSTAMTAREPSELPRLATPEEPPSRPLIPSAETAAVVPTSGDAPSALPKAADVAVLRTERVTTRRSAAPQRPVSAEAPEKKVASDDPPVPASSVPTQPKTESGFLTVDTTPWSIVSEDGKVLGQTPLVHIELPSGVHVLSFKNPEVGLETTYRVTIQAGKTLVKRIGIE